MRRKLFVPGRGLILYTVRDSRRASIRRSVTSHARPRTTLDQQHVKAMAASPELKAVSRRFAELALAKLEQHGQLNVRQREQLRRGLATAGEELDWAHTVAEEEKPVASIAKVMLRLARNGARSLRKDLDEELATKKKETKALEKFAAELHKMAESKKTEYPVILSYDYTARDASQKYVTKTEELELNEASECTSTAEKMERSAPNRAKLTDLMIGELKAKQARHDEMYEELPTFVKSSHQLIREVLATLE